jgi:hypothetical protein
MQTMVESAGTPDMVGSYNKRKHGKLRNDQSEV